LEGLDPTELLAELDRRSPAEVALRLRLVLGAVAARLCCGQVRSAHDVLEAHLPALSARALPAEARPWLTELHNARALTQWQMGDSEAAQTTLAQLGDGLPSAVHNRAVIAEAGERWAPAAQWREAVLPAWQARDFAGAGAVYREALLFAAHSHLSDIYRHLELWTEELDHLDACIATRPYDIDIQRKSIQPLIAIGEGERALHKSSWLLTQRPRDLDVLLDHGTVLASVKGARAAIEYLDELASSRPDALDAVRQRKMELREKLLETAQQRARSGDYRGLFSLARDIEQLVDSPEEKARALLQQAFALSHLADGGERAAMLEQAASRCGEALELTANERLRSQARALQESVTALLAPELLRQADELLRARRAALMELTEHSALPPGSRQQVAGLADAFRRVAELYRRAGELGGERVRTQVAEGSAECERLIRECRRLEGAAS
jgi:hypothetical protein